MKAYQLVEWQQPPEFRDIPVPEPGPGEVLVKVGGAGACHSDLHLVEWPEGTFAFELPFTIGHENALFDRYRSIVSSSRICWGTSA